MLKVILLCTSFAMSGLIRDASLEIDAAHDQTVWWRTQGAVVLGFNDRTACSLYLYGNGRSVIISWHSAGAGESIGFTDQSSKFPNGDNPVVVQIGAALIGDVNHPLTAHTIDNFLSIQLEHPIDTFLSTADNLTLHMPSGVLGFTVDRSKMPIFLDAVQKCRKLMDHLGPEKHVR